MCSTTATRHRYHGKIDIIYTILDITQQLKFWGFDENWFVLHSHGWYFLKICHFILYDNIMMDWEIKSQSNLKTWRATCHPERHGMKYEWNDQILFVRVHDKQVVPTGSIGPLLREKGQHSMPTCLWWNLPTYHQCWFYLYSSCQIRVCPLTKLLQRRGCNHITVATSGYKIDTCFCDVILHAKIVFYLTSRDAKTVSCIYVLYNYVQLYWLLCHWNMSLIINGLCIEGIWQSTNSSSVTSFS